MTVFDSQQLAPSPGAGKILQTDGANPSVNSWVTPSAGVSIGGTITGGTAGSVLFVNPNAVIAQDNANLFYDSTNHSLNIGTLSAVSSTARKVIELNAGGYGEPNAFNVASDGDKIILYRSAAAAYDGTIGVGSLSDMWFKSSGNAVGAGQFKWFTGIGTFTAMVLSGSGDLSVPASFTSASVNTTTINASTINTNTIIASSSGVFQATLNGAAAGSYAGAYIRSVASSAVGYIGLSDSTAGNFFFRDALCVGTQNAFPFRINTNDTARVTVDPTGKVGIGTISPVSLLDVNGDIRSSALTASLLVGTDVNKNLNSITLGTGLSFSGTTLNTGAFVLPVAATGSVGTASTPKAVVVRGNYAYVAANNSIQIYSIVNPASPSLISTTTADTGTSLLSIQGSTLYSASDIGVQVWDISNPVKLSITGTTGVGGKASTALFSAGRFLFQAGYKIADGSFGITIVDVTTPPSYNSSGAYSSGANPTSIFLLGKYFYYTDIIANFLYISDATFPLITLTTNNSVGGIAINVNSKGMYIEGRYAYIVSNGSPGKLQIIDISNPILPVSISSTNLDNGTYAVKKQGKYVYVINNISNTMQAIDVSVPASPSIVGTWSTGTAPTSFDIVGRYAYVVNSTSATLQIFDLGGAYIQQLETGSLLTSQLNVKGVAYLNDLAVYGSTQMSGSLSIQNDFASLGNSNIGGVLAGGALRISQLNNFTPPTVVAQGPTGIATYGYAIVAKNTASGGGDTQITSTTTITNGNDDLAAGPNLITWNQVAGANQYVLYRVTAGGAISSAIGRLATIGASEGVPNGNLYNFLDNDTYPPIGVIPKSSEVNSTGQLNISNAINFSNSNNLLGGVANTAGRFVNISSTNWKNTGTANNGTTAVFTGSLFGIPTLTASNTNVTTTNAYSINILGAPLASTNQKTVNATALNIASSAVNATTTNSYGLQVNAMTGAINNYAANFNGKVLHQAPINLKNYTVATLPAGVQGDTAYVTDALTPGFLVTVVGGGTIVSPVFYNGTNWVAY
jgi:hypothetical protein